jgi:hypothetical protein
MPHLQTHGTPGDHLQMKGWMKILIGSAVLVTEAMIIQEQAHQHELERIAAERKKIFA